jgi:hypothetical protein
VTRFLHVLNGDATRGPLERSDVPGSFAVWADVLHEGPCLLAPPDEWRRLRSRFLAAEGYGPEDEILRRYDGWDQQLDRFGEHDEVVFWLEHDLFDQLLLIRHLHWVASLGSRGGTAFSLICIGAFPGIGDFHGLGQLTPEELASLLETRHPIAPAEIDLGVRAWRAYCAPDPSGLVDLLASDTGALPFLDGAIRRFLSDYPSAAGGLSRTERQILDAIAAGASAPAAAFQASQRMEERRFMGDSTWWRIAQRLAAGPSPLVRIDAPPHGGGRLLEGLMQLTDAGRAVLAGRADQVALNGIDRWMGGVHLDEDRWRWNGRTLERPA